MKMKEYIFNFDEDKVDQAHIEGRLDVDEWIKCYKHAGHWGYLKHRKDLSALTRKEQLYHGIDSKNEVTTQADPDT